MRLRGFGRWQRPATRADLLRAAIEPLAPAVRALGRRDVVEAMVAALPPEAEWRADDGGVRWPQDYELNHAMYPLRFGALLAAGRAGAAHELSPCFGNALWNWEVDDVVWQAALDALDVAMAVCALTAEGGAVTLGMAETHRRVLEIAQSR